MDNDATVAARLYECITAGDIDGLIALLDPDVEWELVGPTEIPHFGRYEGTERVKEFFELLGSHLAVESFEIGSLTPTDSGAVAQGAERARFVKNGASYDMRCCHVIEVRDGLIRRFTDYLDTAPMLDAWRR